MNIKATVSNTRKTNEYNVTITGLNAECSCRHAQFKGPVMVGVENWCRHATMAKLSKVEDLLLRSTALRTKKNWDTLESITRRVIGMRGYDANLAASAILLAGYQNEYCSADDAQDMVGDLLQGDKRVIGISVRELISMELLEKDGYVPSRRVKINHGRPIVKLVITENGREAIRNALLLNTKLLGA